MAGSGVALWCVPSCVGGALEFPDDEEAGHEESHDEYREGRTAGPVEILSGEAVVDHGAREEVARAAEGGANLVVAAVTRRRPAP